MTIGILALQGDVREHTAAMRELGHDVRLVRGPEDLAGIGGIILPGGESTTLSMLLESSNLFDPLAKALEDGLPAFGTCAGMILLAGEVLDGRPDQRRFGMVDVTVRRNGYGRQVASFECELALPAVGDEPVHAVFIRAPVVESSGPSVEVLATLPGDPARPVVCRQGRVLVAAFHPELTGDRRLHRLFAGMVAGDGQSMERAEG